MRLLNSCQTIVVRQRIVIHSNRIVDRSFKTLRSKKLFFLEGKEQYLILKLQRKSFVLAWLLP